MSKKYGGLLMKNGYLLEKKERRGFVIIALCMICVIGIVAITCIFPQAKEDNSSFATNEEIYMYCLDNWEELGVLPSVAIAEEVATSSDVAVLSDRMAAAKGKNMFTEQLMALGDYDTYYINIRKSELYNYDYKMFITIAEQKKTEAIASIEDAEQLERLCSQYDHEIKIYTACLNK